MSGEAETRARERKRAWRNVRRVENCILGLDIGAGGRSIRSLLLQVVDEGNLINESASVLVD